uniref:Uncharacterized protein n=1 Tax=Anguilla anguilla TaxID=7936 RepID=A0A0E9TXI4_ANGAN
MDWGVIEGGSSITEGPQFHMGLLP